MVPTVPDLTQMFLKYIKQALTSGPLHLLSPPAIVPLPDNHLAHALAFCKCYPHRVCSLSTGRGVRSTSWPTAPALGPLIHSVFLHSNDYHLVCCHSLFTYLLSPTRSMGGGWRRQEAKPWIFCSLLERAQKTAKHEVSAQ